MDKDSQNKLLEFIRTLTRIKNDIQELENKINHMLSQERLKDKQLNPEWEHMM